MKRFILCLLLSAGLVLAVCGAAQAKTSYLPVSTEIIGEEAFFGDRSLTEAVLPEDIREIHSKAFVGTGLKRINLPSSIVFIAEDAFDGLENLYAITYPGSYPAQYCDRHGIPHSSQWQTNADSATTASLTVYTGTDSHVIIPSADLMGRTITTISGSIFSENPTVKTVEIPPTVKIIKAGAFTGCSSLETVYLPSDTAVYSGAFPEGDGPTLITYTALSDGKNAQIDKWKQTEPSELILPDSICGRTVTGIGKNAFANCRSLASVRLPAFLETIGESAFSGSGLTSVPAFPASLETVGANAFAKCESMEGNLSLPASLFVIENSAFQSCAGLTGTLVLPDSLLSIGNHAFDGCSGLTGQLILPDSVRTVGAYAFMNCTGFSGRLMVSACLQSVGSYAFGNCSGITGVSDIGPQCTGIGTNAFSGCPLQGIIAVPIFDSNAFPTNLKDGADYIRIVYHVLDSENVQIDQAAGTAAAGFAVPETLSGMHIAVIGNSAFASMNISGPLTLPESLVDIGNQAFQNRAGITGELILPGNVQRIGNGAFQGCTGLTQVVFSSKLQHIGNSAFKSCKGLQGGIAIGNSVESIGSEAFWGCTGITGLTLGDSLESIGDSAFHSCSSLTGSLHFPGTLKTLGNKAFSQCQNLSGPLYFENGIRSIGSEAFADCGALTGSLDFPDTLLSIGSAAFRKCSVLDGTVTFGKRLLVIGENAFISCAKLSGLVFRTTNLLSIGASAFLDCTDIRGSLVLTSCRSIGDNAFSRCGFNGTLTLSDDLVRIGPNAFLGCSFTGGLLIPDKVKTIGSSAFKSVPFSGPLTLGSPRWIGNNAFQNCSGLTGSPSFTDKLVFLGKEAFLNCTGLTGSLILPDSLTEISDSTFCNCTGLTGSLQLPSHITTIGECAFQNCGFTGTLYLPNTLLSIRKYAFADCSGFTGDLILPDHLTVHSNDDYVFAGIGCDGKLVLPYYLSGKPFYSCSAYFGRTRFTAIYCGPEFESFNAYNSDWDPRRYTFGQFRGTVPVPLYYSGEKAPWCSVSSPNFADEPVTQNYEPVTYPYSASPRDGAAAVTIPSVSPIILLETTEEAEKRTANSTVLCVSYTCSVPENKETDTVKKITFPWLTVSGPDCIEVEYLLTDGQELYEDGVLFETMKPGETAAVRVRVTCSDPDPLHAGHTLTIKGSERGYASLSASATFVPTWNVPADSRLKADAKTAGTGSNRRITDYDTTQVLKNDTTLKYFDADITAGNLEIIGCTLTLTNTTLHVAGNLILKDGACLSVQSGCTVTVDGNADIGGIGDGILLGENSTLQLTASSAVTVKNKLTFHGTGVLKQSAGTITVNTFKFGASGKSSQLTGGKILVENEADLNGNFNGKENHILHLTGYSLKCKKGAAAGMLIVDHELEQCQWTQGLSNVLSVAKLVITDSAMKNLVTHVKNFTDAFNESVNNVDAIKLDVKKDAYWDLKYVPNGSIKDDSGWKEAAQSALLQWVDKHLQTGEGSLDSAKALWQNITSHMSVNPESFTVTVNGSSAKASVASTGTFLVNDKIAANGTITVQLGTISRQYTFSLNGKGTDAVEKAYCQLAQKAMFEQLKASIKNAAKDVPYIGSYLQTAAEIYMSALWEGKTWQEVFLGVAAKPALKIIGDEWPTVKKVVEMYSTVCGKYEKVQKTWSTIKDVASSVFKPDTSNNATKEGGGFCIDTAEMTEKALEYIQSKFLKSAWDIIKEEFFGN